MHKSIKHKMAPNGPISLINFSRQYSKSIDIEFEIWYNWS